MKKALKKAGVGILTGVMTLSAFAFGGCDFSEIKDKAKDIVNDVTDSITGTENESVKPSYDGTVLESGETYDFGASPKMAFCSSVAPMSTETGTETQEFETISVTVTATVTPVDANQNVAWNVEFVNSESEWATGKTVTDYVTVTTETEGSTTATVTCLRPFGEQIKLVCTSVENDTINASINIDFLQSLKSVSLTYGTDLPINFTEKSDVGNYTACVTDVVWEVSADAQGVGGVANVVVEMYEDYTIAVDWSYDIYMNSPEVSMFSSFNSRLQNPSKTRNTFGAYDVVNTMASNTDNVERDYIQSTGLSTFSQNNSSLSDGYFVLCGGDIGVVLEDSTGAWMDFNEYLCFNNNLFSLLTVHGNLTETCVDGSLAYYRDYFSKYSSDILSTLFSDIYNGYFASLVMEVTGVVGEETFTNYYTSLLNVTGFTNGVNVTSLVINEGSFYFNY